MKLLAGIAPAWYAKVVLSLALVAWAVLGVAGDPLHVSLWGRALMLAGAAVTLWHFVVMKRAAGSLGAPSRLVTRGGLLPWVRHPMYLGDVALCAGCALVAGHWGAWALLAVFVAVEVTLARAEDRMMSERFGSVFADWRRRTGLFLPRLSRRTR